MWLQYDKLMSIYALHFHFILMVYENRYISISILYPSKRNVLTDGALESLKTKHVFRNMSHYAHFHEFLVIPRPTQYEKKMPAYQFKSHTKCNGSVVTRSSKNGCRIYLPILPPVSQFTRIFFFRKFVNLTVDRSFVHGLNSRSTQCLPSKYITKVYTETIWSISSWSLLVHH
jgi:hypothetical protein